MTSTRWKRGLVTAGALLLGLAVATSSWAQNMFYREVEKDGRLYVFAVMSSFEPFEKSGEMGKSITRLGYGPNGQTVVFDSEDAINLYNFKHNLPGEVFAKPKEAPKPKQEPVAKVGGTIFADYTYQDGPKITDSDKNSIHFSTFEVRRAYINVTGDISSFLSYRITPDITARFTTATAVVGLPPGATVTASTSLDGSLVYRLKYAYGQFNLDGETGHGPFLHVTHGTWIRFGQQQTPFVDFMEGIYRYRFQGTIFEEREGFLSSSDVGASGRFVLPKDYGDIHLGYYNGDTYSRAEINDQKAFQIRGTLRPLPGMNILKGFRATYFYDHDSPLRNGERTRQVLSFTFENKYVNAGYDLNWDKDRAGLGKAEIKGEGWTLWATPRTSFGLEALIRYDHLKPNTNAPNAPLAGAVKSRFIIGPAYWLKVKAPLATAILLDYEEVKYDLLLARPTEKRFEIKTLFNF
jgi:hypothetical protein